MSQKKKLDSAAAIITNLLGAGKSPLARDFQRFRLYTQWQDVVGPTIAGHCKPVSIQNRVLFLSAKSATWMHQLYYVKKEMIAKINVFLEKDGAEKIEDLRFTVG